MYRIGELSALTGVPVKTLRYWSDLRVLVPDLTDRFTGYRYYSDENLEDCRKVIAMKEMGFTLDEIRERDDLLNLAKRKLTETREIIGNLKRREERLEALIRRILKGDSDMTNLSEKIELAQKEAFVNDPGVIGRWSFIDLVPTIGDYRDGETQCDGKPESLSELFFLTGGEGYWIVSGWTKGKLYLHVVELGGDVLCTYETREVNGRTLLFLTCPRLMTRDGKLYGAGTEVFVYEKNDSISRHERDIGIRDKVDYPFTDDPDVHGKWRTVDFLPTKDMEFDPEHPRRTADRLYVKEIDFNPDGTCVRRMKTGERTLRWTKGMVLDDKILTASEYEIRNVNGREYLFLEWKSGDYTYGGRVNVYVFAR